MTTATKSSHTPGPWTIRGWTIQAHDGSDVAVIESAKHLGAPAPERHLNAHLIASAPELLALLDRAQDFCPIPVQDEIRAAIAKATGDAS